MPAESLPAFQSISSGIKHLFLNTECSQLSAYRNLIPALWAPDTPAGGHKGLFSGKEGGNQWKYFRYLNGSVFKKYVLMLGVKVQQVKTNISNIYQNLINIQLHVLEKYYFEDVHWTQQIWIRICGKHLPHSKETWSNILGSFKWH